MRRAAALAALALALPLVGCGGGADRTLTVLAAASLTETFTELAADFEDERPDVDVELVFGSSTTLAEQVADGAPGQVLATADERSMQLAEDALAGPPTSFASNRLVVVAPPGNPAGIGDLDDLDDTDVDYVRCAETAPCGAIAVALLEDAGVTAAPASEEVDVKAVLARVSQGEADAGLVYRTDAVAAGDAVIQVATADMADLGDVYATSYAVAPVTTTDADLAGLASEFVALVDSSRGTEVFSNAGFGGVVRR